MPEEFGTDVTRKGPLPDHFAKHPARSAYKQQTENAGQAAATRGTVAPARSVQFTGRNRDDTAAAGDVGKVDAHGGSPDTGQTGSGSDPAERLRHKCGKGRELVGKAQGFLAIRFPGVSDA